jgi:predicted protein tyrosine phosphatase
MADAPNVLVLSQTRAEAYEPTGREVCISVTDPAKVPARLSDRFAAILRLSFTDITEPIGHPDYVLFDETHARAIVRFVQQWPDVDRIVVHCRAGLGRSPGIAIGLTELFSWGAIDPLLKEHALCNHWVRKELVRAGREALPPQEA